MRTCPVRHVKHRNHTYKRNVSEEDPIARFERERSERIRSFGENEELQADSRDWLRRTMEQGYPYNFSWMGRPIIQYPQDMVAVQELVWSVRPDLIIETGIAHGGSLILSASMLALVELADATVSGTTLDPASPASKVIGVDIDIRPHNRERILGHPMANRIEMIEGSSITDETVEKVRAAAAGRERIMVFLDSMHTHEHVLAELRAYAPLVTEDSYCVVFDSFVEDMPPGFFADRPWDVGNNPKTAVAEFLSDDPGFEVDREMEDKLQVTVAPGGYLKRVARS